MDSIESLVVGSNKLTRVYGRWPSFHDAEVMELHHCRGCIKAGGRDDGHVSPVLTAKIHLFIEGPGSCHTLATLKFEDVEDYRMEGFNHQNAILGLSMAVEERGAFADGAKLPPWLVVTFEPAFGFGASFRCIGIEVVAAVPCDDAGRPHA